jgi:hypothetical protein
MGSEQLSELTGDLSGDLSVVRSTGSGCLILRERSGRYAVSHERAPQQLLRVATLAGAYAACHGWERDEPAGA